MPLSRTSFLAVLRKQLGIGPIGLVLTPLRLAVVFHPSRIDHAHAYSLLAEEQSCVEAVVPSSFHADMQDGALPCNPANPCQKKPKARTRISFATGLRLPVDPNSGV